AGKILLKRTGNAWRIDQPANFDADPDAVKKILDGLLDRTTDYQSDAPKDLSKFGLDKPRVTVTFNSTSRGSKSISLGRKEVSNSSVYALDLSSRRVFLVSASDADSVIGKTAGDLRDKMVLALPEDKLDAISVEKAAGAVELAR